jgi:pimeloyl-ACP methyl ester carboxylesterase
VLTDLALTQTSRTPTSTEIGPATIPTSNHLKVWSSGSFQSGIALDPNKNTVVLTHGWNGSPSDWAAYTAQIIQQRIGANTVNIVAWDWSADAASAWYDLGKIAAKTPGEGVALGSDLYAALGPAYSKPIHFIGHSLGTLVNASAANYLEAEPQNYSGANIQMTLCDEAEVAWEFTSTGWQMATTLPKIVQQGKTTLATLAGNFSTPQPWWDDPLPNQFAWADNYISAFGLLHPDAANIILTYTYPDSFPDVNTVVQEFYNFHDYAHYFYEDTIEPGIFNTGGQINATYAGFICSFEGGGFTGRPAAGTYFYQDPSGLELNLVKKDVTFATDFLNARFANYLSIGVSSLQWQGSDWIINGVGQAVGQVNGQIQNAGQNLQNMVVNLITSATGGALIKSPGAHPLSGPVPAGTGAGNTPAYAWIPLNVPSNALSMSFDFMLQGDGNSDSFQAAVNGTNILTLETSLIQTNVTLNSGLIDISQYAGQTNVELFLGVVGGTSTNAELTVSNFQF